MQQLIMNDLEKLLKAEKITAKAAMNYLQKCGVVLENSAWPGDVAAEDIPAAVACLRKAISKKI